MVLPATLGNICSRSSADPLGTGCILVHDPKRWRERVPLLPIPYQEGKQCLACCNMSATVSMK
jgi:hypothetical protein